MRILMLSQDRNVELEGSQAQQRIKDYAGLVENLEVVVVTKRNYFKLFFFRPKFRPDLVTSQDSFELGFLAWRLAKKFGAKLQLQIHTDFLSPYFAAESLKNKLRVRLAKFLLPRADCIRVVSKRIADSLRTTNYELRTSPVVLPIFVDVEKIRNAPITIDLHKKYPQFDFIILVASRLSPEKNITLALDAFREVIKKYPKTGFVIVGAGPELEKLKLRTTNYELQTNVVFEPPVPFETLISYYKTADLFLLASNYEGYGLTLIEAAAAGCPILTSDIGLIGEVLKRESILSFPVGDKAALTKLILAAVSGQVSLEELSRRVKINLEAVKTSRFEFMSAIRDDWERCLK